MSNDLSNVTHGFAEVNGIRLHYAETGSGSDLVVLLHGFPEFWYSWRHQLAFLGERHHVIAPDMRGYNLSDKPAGVANYTTDVLVEDVVGLIDYFGVKRAAVVGHDWGAGVVWAVAQKHPERLSKLAVLQVPPAAVWRDNMSLRQLLRSHYMFLFQLPRLPEFLTRFIDFASIDRVFRKKVGRIGSFSDEDIEAYKTALRQPGALISAINYYRANVFRVMRGTNKKPNGETSDHRSANPRISVPTLFIFGEQDFAILPETVRGVGNYIDAPYREVRIPDSGHWVQNEAPNEVNNALAAFLSTDYADYTHGAKELSTDCADYTN